VLHQLAVCPDTTADELVEMVAGVECGDSEVSEQRVRAWIEASAAVNDLDKVNDLDDQHRVGAPT